MSRDDPFLRTEPAARNKITFLLLCGFRDLLGGVFHGQFGSAFYFWIQVHHRYHTFLVVRIRVMQAIQNILCSHSLCSGKDSNNPLWTSSLRWPQRHPLVLPNALFAQTFDSPSIFPVLLTNSLIFKIIAWAFAKSATNATWIAWYENRIEIAIAVYF